jgi:hypothetical protein
MYRIADMHRWQINNAFPLFALTAITLLSFSYAAFPFLRGYYTPEEAYRSAAALVGRTITVRGQVEIVTGMCTEEMCGEDPCCNYCSYGVGLKIDAFHFLNFSGEGAGYLGDNCHTGCSIIMENQRHEITGRAWKDLGDLYCLELIAWRRID